MPKILIVTGEASGDLHGANLAIALRTLMPDIELLGMGGENMNAAGVRLLHRIQGHDVVGMVGLRQLWSILRTYRALGRFLRTTPLDAVVFIDNPGFNLRMARIAARAGHRVIYYIAPQIWAWHSSRIRVITRVVHHMIVILPFEVALYRRAGISCDFVGHPLLDDMAPAYDRAELRKRFDVDGASAVVGLFPGSREKEVRALLSRMIGAGERLSSTHRGLQFLIAKATSLPDGLIENLVSRAGLPFKIVEGRPSEVMAASDVVLVASGTATLQAACIGTPMVITYRVSWVTYWVARFLVRVQWIGLVNILAGRTIVPELIQHAATPERLCEEVARLLGNPRVYEAMVTDLRAIRSSLGDPGASRRAAAIVLAECRL